VAAQRPEVQEDEAEERHHDPGRLTMATVATRRAAPIRT